MKKLVRPSAALLSLMFLALFVFLLSCASKPDKPVALTFSAVNVIPATEASPSFDSRFNTLQAEMTLAQVKALLGPPALRELNGSTETWHYKTPELASRKVVFERGLVTAFTIETDTSPTVQAGAVPTPAVNLEIGQACKADKECKGHNCHFHVCAGKNNCTVSLGQVCGADTDCCSNFCDFGFCKSR